MILLLIDRIRQIRIRVVLGRQSLLPAPAGSDQLPLLRVPPLHSPVLEPDLDLKGEEHLL